MPVGIGIAITVVFGLTLLANAELCALSGGVR
jgi:hypothetical protein